jgi:hypothetical protein
LNRKLVLLNLVLAAVAVYAGVQWRNQWKAAKAREAAMLHKSVKPTPPVKFDALPVSPPVLAAGYKEIAEKMLFDRERNSNVPIELPPPAPPPPPMPALPRYHGTLNLGDGLSTILSESPASAHQEIKPGQKIGQFTLVDVNTVQITFEWNGEMVRRRLDELTDRTVLSSANADSRTPSAPPPPVAQAKQPTGPGESTPFGFKICTPNDSTPDGAVVGGFRKVSIPTPFGNACRWDPVGK